MKTEYDLSQVILNFREKLLSKHGLTEIQLRTLNTLALCRTSALGGHVDACPECGYVKVSYNSCRNRHCPKCQGLERERWVQARKEDLLPVKYFHVVFTIPDTLHPLFLGNQSIAYSSLFHAAWNTVTAFSERLGVQAGMFCLLHTWGSNLQYHPHLHCIVPAGGVDDKGQWKPFPNADNKSPYLFSVKAMGSIFRAKLVATLSKQMPVGGTLRKKLFEKPWVVFSKHPFLGTEKVVEYLGRYSHRVAISNRRIKQVDEQKVVFEYKDYKQGAQIREMTLDGEEFLRRFCLHILPKGFVRIRHFGFLSAANRDKLRQVQVQMQQVPSPKVRKKKKWEELCRELFDKEPGICPCCKEAEMICVQIIPIRDRAPPNTCEYIKIRKEVGTWDIG